MTDLTGISTDPDDLARQLRRNKVLALRLSHAPLSAIAEACEVSVSTVRADIAKAMAEAKGTSREDLLAEHRLYLEQMRRAAMPAAIKGDVAALGVLQRSLEREAKLRGLDAPAQLAVGLSSEDFAATAAALFRELGLDAPPEIANAIDAEVVAITSTPAMDGDDCVDYDEPWV